MDDERPADGASGAHSHGPHRSAARPALPEGAGRDGWLFLDCPSGIAGDMTLAALLDLGVPIDVIRRALGTLPIDGYELELGHAHHHGITATTVRVLVHDDPTEERPFSSIAAMLDAAALTPEAKRLAQAVFHRLAEAEAAVHGTTIGEVTFHEVGAIDSIVDIVGSAAAIAYLGAEVLASPVPLGRGFVKARHGTLPLPAPATVHCLQGVPTYGVGVEAELVTPTGAALLAALTTRFESWPTFVPEHIGYGAGSRTLPDRPNVLRVVLGHPTQDLEPAGYEVLEANVDDLTDELAGHAIAALLEAGAADAWACPIVGKKGRPALTLAALAPREPRGARTDPFRSHPSQSQQRPRAGAPSQTRVRCLRPGRQTPRRPRPRSSGRGASVLPSRARARARGAVARSGHQRAPGGRERREFAVRSSCGARSGSQLPRARGATRWRQRRELSAAGREAVDCEGSVVGALDR